MAMLTSLEVVVPSNLVKLMVSEGRVGRGGVQYILSALLSSGSSSVAVCRLVDRQPEEMRSEKGDGTQPSLSNVPNAQCKTSSGISR